MQAKKNKTETLPTIKEQTFELSIPLGDNLILSEEIAKELTDDDFSGFEEEGQALPIVGIRQKPLQNKKGQVTTQPGGFKMYDPVTHDQDFEILDQEQLTVTFLLDQSSRVYFKQGVDKPLCRSADAKVGIGEPGGNCDLCELGQLQNGSRSECTSQKNVLVRDTLSGTCYVVRFGPSGLKPYRNIKNLIDRQKQNGHKIPLSAFIVRIESEFKSDPQPHYIPKFTIVNMVSDLGLFNEIRQIRKDATGRFNTTIDVVTIDEEQVDSGPGTTPEMNGSEIPQDATAVNTGTGEILNN